ncbi:TetR/AcrR family transcriptional regulator [uncultured Pelagimonas sp.]|uniref:TetR/AcrR family transcriptional regulator n=1 Tax=uncultured Pelagimonas sp. TaxID=1618102 RepID=UPI0026348E75|nr:TetR/AcrR family transcriptional regulator [uncultured Pelagimonas sp.]
MKDDTGKDPAKIHAILTAALQTFSQYGYRKTSMEDLARAAGMSRPALYQYFRNKDDVACSLVRGYFTEAVGKVRAALAEPGHPEQVLEQAFRAKLDGMEEVLSAPHGEELLELGHAVSAEDVAEGMAQLEQGFADWLEVQSAAGVVRYEGEAREVARVIVSALDGIKKPPFDQLDANLVQLAKLIGRGLST